MRIPLISYKYEKNISTKQDQKSKDTWVQSKEFFDRWEEGSE